MRASAYAYQAANAVKVSGVFSGDITGFQSNISVEKIKGIPVSGIVPTNGQVLAFDGTQYSPLTVSAPVGVTSVSAVAPLVSTGGATPQISMAQASSSGSGYLSSSDWTIFSNKLSNFSTMTSNDVTTALGYTPQNSSSSVTSVAGKTGVVTLTSSDITGLDQFVLSTTAVSGDITGTFSSLSVEQVGGKTKTEIQAAVSQVQAATTSATASTIALRDGSGNLTAQNFSAQNFSGKNLYLFDASNANSIVIRPPVSFSSYTLTLPTTTGASGQVLSTNGAGTLSWITPASNPGTVTSVTSANSYMTISNSTSTPVITLQVGSAANTVAAGDDVRITGALQTSAFNAAVASANCSNVQSAYWNSVSSQFMCQDIGTIPSAQDFTGILSGDISGTQMAVSVDKIKNVPVSATAPTTGQAMVYNGTAWAPAAGVPQLIKKTADQTFTSTTVAAVTGQSFPVVAGKTYKFKFNILYSTAATTTGIKLGMTYPAATIFSARTSATGSTADGTANEFNGTLNSSGDIVTATSTQTGINFGFVEGIITPSAAGAVQLTTGTEVNGSAVVFRAGSFVEVLELP